MSDHTFLQVDESEGNQQQRKPLKALEARWGKHVIEHGWCALPSFLLRNQRILKISPSEMVVILHILDYWWGPGQLPFPSKATLADRIGMSARQVQRHVAALEKKGYVRRFVRDSSSHGRLSNIYDVTGLIKELQWRVGTARAVNADSASRAKTRSGTTS